MAAKLICPVCGKEFEACRSCNDNDIYTWKNHTDTEECFKIYVILHRVYVTNKMTKEEAKEKLKEFNFSDLESYPESTKNQIKGILNVGKRFANKPIAANKTVEAKKEDKVEVAAPLKEDTVEEPKKEVTEKVIESRPKKKGYNSFKK